MKQEFLKRFGALLLAAVMLIGMLPVGASAAEALSVAFADPYAAVGQPMNLTVTGGTGSYSYSWTVDGAEVGKDATYTPAEEDLMKWISVSVKSGTETAKAEMFFSNLPVIYINTENNAPIVSKEDYINAELVIQGNETYNSGTTTLYNGVTEIRGRGNSTWTQPKKPYRLKLDKKTDVFGMGKSKHWVLLANYMDESLLRNTLAYDLSGAMGMEQCSTVFVDVILNGDFVGNYQFCENIRIDDTRVDIFDWEGFAEDSAGVIADAEGLDSGDLEEYMAENMGWITSGSFTFGGKSYSIANYPDIEIPSINGGYLIELDEYYDEISKFKTASGQPIMFKNPEYLNTNSDMMNFVKTYIQAFEDAVESDSYTSEYEGEIVHYSELYDFDALVDYWLISEIFFNEELNKKSTYMYKDIDSLMMMGPIWDMDWSSGGEGQTYHTEQWATRYYSTNAQANQWYKYLIQDPYFFLKAQERYWEIRNDQVADMMTQIDESYEMLKDSAAANGERWGYSKDYKTYVDSLRSWFNSHLTWLDAQMETQDLLRDSLGYHPSSRLALSVTDADGNAIGADLAKTAPADYAAQPGEELKLVVTGGSDTNGNAVLYVNGRRTSVTAVEANSTYTLDVPADSLNAPEGEKNVLEIQIEKADGTINASRYVTVIFTEGHEHSYEAVVTEPTCTEGGYTTYTCYCGDSYVSDKTEALGHDEQIIPGVEATFDDKGLSDGVECARCGLVLVSQEETPVRDYNEGIIPLEVLIPTAGDWQTGYEATEGPANLAMDDNLNTIWHTDWYGTSRADHWIQFELTESYAVDGLRYKPRVTGNTNGTITKYDIQVSDDGETFRSVASGDWEGNRNWKVVSFDAETVKYVRLVAVDALTDNAYVFASASEIRLTGVKADAHEHSYEALVTAPTCTEPGCTTYTCACGDTYTADETEALGHDYDVVVTEPTCTEGGYSTYTCSRCGDSYVGDETAALGHTEEVIPGTEATFDSTGLTEGKVCDLCGEILVQQEEIPMLDYNDGIIPLEVLIPTAGDWQRGLEEIEGPAELAMDDDLSTIWHTYWYGTSRDDHWIQFEITESYTVDGLRYKPRTTGSTNGTITRYDIQVSEDGETFTSVASGDWEGNRNWKVVEFEGVQVKYVRLVAVDALTDNDYVFASAAEIRLTGEKADDAHQHSYEAVVTAPTCTEGGYTTYTCSCGDSYTSDETAALGHDFVNGECTRCDAVKDAPFVDVPVGSFYFDPVEWAVENGITTGVDADHFNPNGQCQRAVVVTFLWRAAGSPEPASTANPFTDVKESDFFYKAVLWAVEKGITNGISATEFAPYALCNRAQVVTFLWRAQGQPAPTTTENPFSDVVITEWYGPAVLWAVENGITNGMGDGTFGVGGICNRAQVVTFLYRAMVK